MAGDAPVHNTIPGAPGGAAAGPALRLVVVGPVATGRYARRPLAAGRMLVGRAADNDLVLDEPSVSARHARIDVDVDGTYLTDLGSTNGSRHNGRRVTGSVQLQAGDEVTLGRCVLRIEAAPTGEEPGTVAAPAARGGPPVIPARHPRRLLVSFDQADHEVGAAVVERLERIGHTVLAQPGPSADAWGGRLLDAMWSVDAAVFVVSHAAAGSEKVHREVHLAGAEHTTVIPVRIDDVVLPADLAYYEQRRPAIDLRRDPAAGLSELQRQLDEVRAKRIARPARLVRRLVAVALLVAFVAAVWLVVR